MRVMDIEDALPKYVGSHNGPEWHQEVSWWSGDLDSETVSFTSNF